MNQYICKIYVIILLAATDIAQRSETRCSNASINRCRNSIPGPAGVFAYRTCESSSSFQYRCVYQCNSQNCNNYCISYGNGFNGGNCQHNVVLKRTSCLCMQNGMRGSNNTRPGQGQPPNGGQSGQGGQQAQWPPNGGQSGQGPPNGQPGQGRPPPPQDRPNEGQEQDSSRDSSN